MDTLIKNIKNLNLKKQNIIRTKKNTLVIFKSKYKYTDCIYINIINNIYSIKYDRIFDNKDLNYSIERLMIFNKKIYNKNEVILNIKSLLKE